MRLLKTDTLDFLPEREKQSGKYAIFSHTWGKDEVIFADLSNGNPESKPAYDKVKSACRRAAADNYSYIWIDSCCIDKSSSADLSEAINSMYVWYQQADICYAYLADVDASTDTDIQTYGIQKSSGEGCMVQTRMDVARTTRSYQNNLLRQGLDGHW